MADKEKEASAEKAKTEEAKVEKPKAEASKKPDSGKTAEAAAEKKSAPQEKPVGDKRPEERGDRSSDRRGRRGRSIPAGVAHIRATFNNTIVTISDARGNVLSWSASGKAGFKGSRKSTAFAGTMVAQDAARTAMGKGMHELEVRVQGAGAGRESAVRGLQSSGMHISVIKDVTPIAHNGCRARKRRRV